MVNTKSDFRKRKKEIDEYFSFLKVLNKNNIFLKYDDHDDFSKEFPISIELQKILAANTFLLLYNLMESTVRNSIIEIYNKIQDDKVSYLYLSKKIKKIWVQKNSKDILNSDNQSIKQNLQNVIDKIICDEIIVLTKDDIQISGNIDAQKIRNLACEIGFQKSDNGRYLEEIKNKRNRLAHGEQTFHDIGKNVTYGELRDRKQNIFDYLEDVIKKIEIFIESKNYKEKQ
jgi:hypothetical protein